VPDAGSLAALVHLGHPVIAMRAPRAAWSDGPVDVDTAVWLINEVLDDGSPASQIEASSLLCEHAGDLCDNRDGHGGEFSWPALLYSRWPTKPVRACRFEILFAIARVVLSRDKSWWGYDYDWSLVLLDEAMMKDPDPVLKHCARHLLRPLAESYAAGANRRNEFKLPWGNETKDLSVIEQRAHDHQEGERITKKTQDLVAELEHWRSSSSRHASPSEIIRSPFARLWKSEQRLRLSKSHS